MLYLYNLHNHIKAVCILYYSISFYYLTGSAHNFDVHILNPQIILFKVIIDSCSYYKNNQTKSAFLSPFQVKNQSNVCLLDNAKAFEIRFKLCLGYFPKLNFVLIIFLDTVEYKYTNEAYRHFLNRCNHCTTVLFLL